MLWDRCSRGELPAWSRDDDTDADAETGEEHGGRGTSGSIVRPLPSFKHPAGSHLRLLGVSPGSSAGAGYAEPNGKRIGHLLIPPPCQGFATISIFAVNI
jgi:hypothetical protein